MRRAVASSHEKRRAPLRHGVHEMWLHRTLESWQARRANPSPYTLQGTSLASLAMEHSPQLTQPASTGKDFRVAVQSKMSQRHAETQENREREMDRARENNTEPPCLKVRIS